MKKGAHLVVYLSYSQTELDACYDQRVWAADPMGAMARCASASAEARASTVHIADIPYGPGGDERLDWFSAPKGAPVHIHIHGGAWRLFTKEDASFAAPAFVGAGIHHVVPNFSKLPAARLPDVVDQLVRAVETIYLTADEHGADRGRILVSGHSSGAHLAAVLMTLDWRARGLPSDIIKAGLCVGGVYDMEPVLLSSRSAYVHLDPAEALALSPIRHVSSINCPVTLVHGGRESPEFIRQAQAFAEKLRAAGRLVAHLEMPESDHFDVNEAFGVVASPVHQAAMAALSGMARKASDAA